MKSVGQSYQRIYAEGNYGGSFIDLRIVKEDKAEDVIQIRIGDSCVHIMDREMKVSEFTELIKRGLFENNSITRP